ncbi:MULTISPECIES: LapA family protein [Halomonas]|uniref:LapA family protein n=1 Tax=Halomonas TaxID=2745 RepID=UPI001C96B3B8|nr:MULTISPECIES: LapA family protein [Halomonas]MBY6029913.1 LapA family protein [Halomonas sp. DP8Y7-1]MBY6209153.1 LapA family protein [Halomonas sp. DP3Y7-2]MBY6229309.1 LapA family protein [Halomonas sp. DP3Y7-1]MCA0917628.1 LapA family protein [Halomonas denitrificans]
MDKVWLVVKVVILALVAIVVVQNIDMVQVNLLGWTLAMPMALLVVVIYLLGMVSGRGLMGLIRRLKGKETHRH